MGWAAATEAPACSDNTRQDLSAEFVDHVQGAATAIFEVERDVIHPGLAQPEHVVQQRLPAAAKTQMDRSGGLVRIRRKVHVERLRQGLEGAWGVPLHGLVPLACDAGLRDEETWIRDPAIGVLSDPLRVLLARARDQQRHPAR